MGNVARTKKQIDCSSVKNIFRHNKFSIPLSIFSYISFIDTSNVFPHPCTHLHVQTSTSGYREQNGVLASGTNNWQSKEAWSELVFTVDNSLFAKLASNSVYGGGDGPLNHGLLGSVYRDNSHLRVRCETNIFTLYKGAEEVELEIQNEPWPFNNGLGGFGAKVSPTTDLRGSSSSSSSVGNNPDNSALTGSSGKNWLARIGLVLLVVQVICLS